MTTSFNNAEIAYRKSFKDTLELSRTLSSELESRLSTIQALVLSEEYLAAPLKVMIMGQETAGNYAPLNAVDRNAPNWQEIELERALKDERDSLNSPFLDKGASSWWRAYREICDNFGLISPRSAAWTNISKVQLLDDRAGSVSIYNLRAADKMEVLRWQKRLIRAEIEYAKPDVIMMLTGGMSWMALHLFDQLETGKLAGKMKIEGASENTMGLRSDSLANTVAGFTLHPGARTSNDEKARLRTLLVDWLKASRAAKGLGTQQTISIQT
jgi:hypothetical protein